MTLPRTVLLDLDDTILDDSGAAARCWPEACAAHQAELGTLDPAELMEAIERVRRHFWADAERHRVGRLDLDTARAHVVATALAEIGAGANGPPLARRIAATYGALRDRDMRPFSQSIETVQWLRENGCRLALVTNGAGAAQRRKIDRFSLAPLFDLILIEGEVGFGKPDPRIYQRALDALGVGPEDAWMIGDNLDWDVAPPQSLGIYGIWIDLHGAGPPAGHAARPDRIVRALAELRPRTEPPSFAPFPP
jgi:putative hydrolase of the HAD superfamily